MTQEWCLPDTGVDWRDRHLINKLYIYQQSSVIVGETLSETCHIRTGVKQGCSLSPLLFIICDEDMVREVRHECEIGNTVEGKTVNTIRYADDKAVVASFK